MPVWHNAKCQTFKLSQNESQESESQESKWQMDIVIELGMKGNGKQLPSYLLGGENISCRQATDVGVV